MVHFAAASEKLPLRTYLLTLYGGSIAGSRDFQRILDGIEKDLEMSSVGRKRI